MSAPAASPYGFRYIGAKRRTKEHPRFVTGRGRYAADIALPGLKHVALVASPHASARIVSIDTDAARAVPGVHYVLTGEEFCAATRFAADRRRRAEGDALGAGARARALCRRMGRRGGRGHARARRGRGRAGRGRVRAAAARRSMPEQAIDGCERRWCIRRTARTSSCTGNFVWGPVEEQFAQAPSTSSRFRATLGPQRDGADRDLRASRRSGIPATEILDVWASIQMPKYPDQAARALRLPGNAVRVHYDVDVGGSYGVKRGIKHTVLVGYLAKQPRHAGAPDRGPAREHARRRHARPRPHLRHDTSPSTATARIRALKIRAHRRRRRLCRPLAVPARQAGERDLRALSHRARSPTSRSR